MPLRPLHDDLFEATDVHSMYGVRFPVRMTVIRHEDGLTLVSPVPIDDALADELGALGPVARVVAPNALHDAYLPAAAARFPDAEVFVAPRLLRAHPDLGASSLADATLPDLHTHFIEGAPAAQEFVFVHARSRTLVVTDLVFHMLEAENWLSRMTFRYVARTLGHLGQSRLWRRFTKDRAAAGRSCDALLEHDFDRLIMSHGEVVEGGAHERLAEALTWMRGQD